MAQAEGGSPAAEAAGASSASVKSGKFVFGDGAVYEGEFRETSAGVQRHGEGSYSDGAETYTGSWESDEMHGRGEYRSATGATFVGELKEGLYDGHGVYSWPDGAQYTGEWQAGLMHGEGSYRSGAGVTWVGTFYRGRYDTGKAYVDVRDEK
ncbi:hypothetical protein FNF27_07505 [Cafeteria roenbergensis]|uniref:MORN repeat-containing protein 5 n=1 Tax=Cafeteria roenbergensis TaxID=33653 RepID=A0A5A8CPM1_CAFRO|nr:hypothetical protein FNF29_02760 [Cafeteria roenbergensis]KAA0166343.1 hypothetical protein FNF27_07505 [Cafeteria roenbergensis]KAA0166875.1 hypothetical protein FNF31_01250 [Cafeteria roenbergensis]KAA0169459.1 hypothetical protein FNF28_02071 [Cafeteria roenbergensis]|eukprot:KAA0154140.1 hypothetical protein FNF29_02760 [Cafeteria roenbergensis]